MKLRKWFVVVSLVGGSLGGCVAESGDDLPGDVDTDIEARHSALAVCSSASPGPAPAVDVPDFDSLIATTSTASPSPSPMHLWWPGPPNAPKPVPDPRTFSPQAWVDAVGKPERPGGLDLAKYRGMYNAFFKGYGGCGAGCVGLNAFCFDLGNKTLVEACLSFSTSIGCP